MPEEFLVEKKIKRVYLRDKQKYSYILQDTPQVMDPNSGVLEA